MKKPLTVPTFVTEADETAFWDSLDLSEYFAPSDFKPGRIFPELQHSTRWAASRITHQPEAGGGEPVVQGTHIPLWLIRDFLAMGVTPAQIIRDYPPLTGADLAAIAIYAADHVLQRPAIPDEAAPGRGQHMLYTEAELGYPTEAQGAVPAFHNRIEEAAFWDTHDIMGDPIEDVQSIEMPGDEPPTPSSKQRPSGERKRNRRA